MNKKFTILIVIILVTLAGTVTLFLSTRRDLYGLLSQRVFNSISKSNDQYPKEDTGEISFAPYDYTAPDNNDNDVNVGADGKPITKLTPQQEKEKYDLGVIANKAAIVMHRAIQLAHDDNIDGLIALTDPESVKELGTESINTNYQNVVNYFQDFKSIDEDDGVISRLKDSNGSWLDGIVFQESFTTETGGTKMFSLMLQKNDSNYYIIYFLPGETTVIAGNQPPFASSMQTATGEVSQVLPGAPLGFVWQKLEEINGSVLKPYGWHFRHEENNGTQAYFISKEEITGKDGQFDTGLTMNVIKSSGIPGENADEYAKVYAGLYAEKGSVEFFDKREDNSIISFKILKTDQDNESTWRTAVNILANKKTNTLYLIIFESPVDIWGKEWIKGIDMLNNLAIDDEY